MTVYATAAQLKKRLSIPVSNTDSDDEITLILEAVSRDIDLHCERPYGFGTTSATRTFPAATDYYSLAVGDLVSVSAIATDLDGSGLYATAWAGTDWRLEPTDAGYSTTPKPYTSIRAIGARLWPYGYETPYGAVSDTVRVTGVFGWPAVPAGVTQACLILCAEGLKLGDAPFGVAGFGEFGAVRIRDNPIALKYLAPFVRMPIKVG